MVPVERLPIKVNIKDLVRSLHDEIFPLGEMSTQGKRIGLNYFKGYSLLSHTGDWANGFEYCPGTYKDGVFQAKWAKYLGYANPMEQSIRTKACTAPFSEIIDLLEENGFYPRNGRITCMMPNSETHTHRDELNDPDYGVRLHIPLITNDKCMHHSELGNFHMEADGSVYLIPVNINHKAVNHSNEKRFHFIVDVYDTNLITTNFKYLKNINVLIQRAEIEREQLDRTEVTEQDIIEFDKIVEEMASEWHKTADYKNSSV